MAMNDKPSVLSVGDQCRLLRGVSLYDVTISEAATYMEDEPCAFTMYRVVSREYTKYFEEHSQHRSDLFRWPEERALLAERIDGDITSLRDMLRDVEAESMAFDDTDGDTATSPAEPLSPADVQREHLDTFGDGR